MKRYSKIHKVDSNEFRYDFQECILEFGYTEDGVFNVLDGCGLSKDNWNNGKEGYLMVYSNDIDTEFRTLMEIEGY